jgi:carboxyl-terminal processing protease
MNRTKTRRVALLAAGMVIGLSLALRAASWRISPRRRAKIVPWQDARLLAEVLERVEREYVDPVDDHQLLQAAIRGMVSSLDPYSAYLDGDEYDDIKISSSGQYSGVGIEVSMEDGQVVVVAPLDGSPAAEAGIRSGDVIATIDGVPVNYDDAGRHHRAHARQGRHLGQDRHPARGQHRAAANSRSSARACSCTA